MRGAAAIILSALVATSVAHAAYAEAPGRSTLGLGAVPDIVLPGAPGEGPENRPGPRAYHAVTCLSGGRLVACRSKTFAWAAAPPDASGRDLAGVVQVICVVASEGELTDCRAGKMSFDGNIDAALGLTPEFRVPKLLDDGTPTTGGYVMFVVVPLPAQAETHTHSSTTPPSAQARSGALPFTAVETDVVPCRSRLDISMHTLLLAGRVGLPMPTLCAPTESFQEVQTRFQRDRSVFNQLAAEAESCGGLPPMSELNSQFPTPTACRNGGADRAARLRALMQRTQILSLRIMPEANPAKAGAEPPEQIIFTTGFNGLAINPGSSASEIVYVRSLPNPPSSDYQPLGADAPHWFYELLEDEPNGSQR